MWPSNNKNDSVKIVLVKPTLGTKEEEDGHNLYIPIQEQHDYESTPYKTMKWSFPSLNTFPRQQKGWEWKVVSQKSQSTVIGKQRFNSEFHFTLLC